MPAVRLDRAGIDAVVRHLEPAGVTQHVGVDLEAKLRLGAHPLDHLLKAVDRNRSFALAHEQVRAARLAL